MKKTLSSVAAALLCLATPAWAGHQGATPNATCIDCHSTNLLVTHGGFLASTCNRCHSSPRAEVKAAIAAGQQTTACVSCHPDAASGHAVAHATTYFPSWASLPGVVPAATPPWTQVPSWTPVSPATAQYQVCFRCHSGFSFGELTNGITRFTGSDGYLLTDVARELNPKNVGFHPVEASNFGSLGSTGNILPPFSRTTTMQCTDCHQATLSGAGAVIGLKGANTRWDTSLTLGSRTGAFCFNCHSSSFTNSRYPGHNVDDHARVQCFGCHAAVPHGGPRPGVLVAPAGAFNGTIDGWDQTAPYYQGTGDRLYIKSYPAAGGTWGESNCGCNGTQHD